MSIDPLSCAPPAAPTPSAPQPLGALGAEQGAERGEQKIKAWIARLRRRAANLLVTLRYWPWLDTVRTLRVRLREDSLGMRASSLTFTTIIALVPLLTVMLAVFSAFPMFSSFQGALEKYFLQALIPENIAKPVLRSLTQFAGNARTLGAAGLLLLVVSAMAMMLTFDRTLNRIWRVRRARPMMQRVLIYWSGITLGPLAMGVALTIGSYALTASKDVAQALPGGFALLLDVAEFALLAAAAACVYHFVPHTAVQWKHAWGGALFVAVAVEVSKRLLAWYVKAVPSYSAIYGAFATLPIFLLWIYLLWLIVLLGAVVAAYAPSLASRVVRRPQSPGLGFELALALLALLHADRQRGAGGATMRTLCERLRADPLQIDSVMERLEHIDWVARLDEAGPEGEARFTLLCDPALAPAKALVQVLLLAPGSASARFAQWARLDGLTLQELLPQGEAAWSAVRLPAQAPAQKRAAGPATDADPLVPDSLR
jgi:membrane protein